MLYIGFFCHLTIIKNEKKKCNALSSDILNELLPSDSSKMNINVGSSDIENQNDFFHCIVFRIDLDYKIILVRFFDQIPHCAALGKQRLRGIVMTRNFNSDWSR